MSKKVIKKLVSILFTVAVIYGVASVVIGYYNEVSIKATLNRYLRDENYKDIISYVDLTLKDNPSMNDILAYKGRALIELDRNEEAINVLLKAIKENPADAEALNSLTWAYYNMGNYEEAIKYGKNGAEVNPYDDSIFTNLGNAYFSMGNYEEAINSFNEAIKINIESTNALYGRGRSFLEIGNYDKAIEDLYSYNNLYTDDSDGLYYLGQAYMYSRDYENALATFDKALKINNNDVYAYIGKGQTLDNEKKYTEAIKCYEYAIGIEPDSFDAYINMGASYYEQQKYQEAIKAFQRAMEINNKVSSLYAWMARVYMGQKDYKMATKYCDEGIKLNDRDAFLLNTKSILYYNLEDYNVALEAARSAISLDRYYEDAYISAANSLYKQNNYGEGIKIVEEGLELFPESLDLNWSLGDLRSASNKHEEAIEQFKKVYEMDRENSHIVMDLAWEHFYIQDYNGAAEYISIAEKLNTSKEELNTIKELLKEARLPEGQRVANFIRKNYLYINKVKDFEKKASALEKKGELDINDINEFIKSIVVSEDHFSYFVYGKEYEAINQEEIDLHVTEKNMDKDIKYINIPGFVDQTDNEFVNLITKVEKPENKNLVIDLRDNTGGSIGSANGILDALLGKTVSSSLVDRNGRAYDYNSDKNQIPFKRIFILVNENSASSSEILTLGLKRNLNNVTIIGHPTYGKGVGQLTFENKKDKYAIFITNFYWKVKNENIMGKSIVPDLLVKDSREESYLNEVKRLIGQ